MGFVVRNLDKIGGFPINVFVPPTFSPEYKIIIETSSESIDVTRDLIDGSYTDGITETIGNFSIIIDNSSQQYTNRISLYDKLKIYLDYGEPTTLVFTGLIERPSSTDNRMILTGRSSAVRTIGKLVTYSATEKARSEILKEIVDKYFMGIISTSGVDDDLEIATVNYVEKPFWEVVEELCSAGSYDAYIDANFVLYYFPSGSIINETEAIVNTVNLIETSDFSPDLQSVTNRVKVYGADNDGVRIIATAEDTASQSSYDIKEVVVTDSGLTTLEDAQAKADYELSKNLTPPIVGTVKCLLLPTLKPGERLRISDSYNGLLPTEDGYTIQKFTHIFSNDEPPQTEVTVQKERSSIPQILKKRIKFEYTVTDTENANEMKYSIVNTFDTDTGTHNNTKIESGSLYATSLPAEWVSPVFSLTYLPTQIESRFGGNNLAGVSVFFSTDGGGSYTYVPNTEVTSISSETSEYIIKVVFDSTSTELKTIGLYYK